MINNFDKIEKLLNFDDLTEDDFFFGQILLRNKDRPDIIKRSKPKVIKDFFLNKNKRLDGIKEEVIAICNALKARAYIQVNKRSYKKASLRTLALLADRVSKEEYISNSSIWTTICGRYHDDKNKKFLLDLDNIFSVDDPLVVQIKEFINSLEPKNITNKFIDFIPTKNGIHLITSGFNENEFSNKYPNIDVHKCNPTVLYIP